MSDENIINFPTNDTERPGLGGLVEKSSVTLAIYGRELVPNEITKLLGAAPTQSFLRGEKKGIASERGAWFLTVRSASPEGPEQILERLFNAISADNETIIKLATQYEIQFRFVIRMFGYNRGFDIDSALTKKIASLNASIGFSIYSEEEDENA